MNHKEQLIELATLVLTLDQATEAYCDSDRTNAQERLGVLSEIQKQTVQKAKEVLAAANRPEEHPFHAFQRLLSEWAEAFFTPEAGRFGQPVLLEEALPNFRLVHKKTTVQPFLKCLQGWAESTGRSYVYGTFRVRGLVRRGVIIGPSTSNN